MYETEVQHSQLEADAIPLAIRRRFEELHAITHAALILLEEHCTECAWPSCYSTCDLYNPRNDGHCRRTLDGFSPVPKLPGVVRVRFKQWGVLSSPVELALHDARCVAAVEAFSDRLSAIARALPHFGGSFGRPGLASRLARKAKRQKVRHANAGVHSGVLPNCFILEVYNPNSGVVDLSLVIAPEQQTSSSLRYQKLLNLSPGYQFIRIPFDEIETFIGSDKRLFVSISPNLMEEKEEGLTLFFGRTMFALDEQRQVHGAAVKTVKIMIWDLDNTIWDGTLVEDGPDKLQLRPKIRQVIKALDDRGIINSIASKNDFEPAMQLLAKFGLADYFVFPEINWGPKSQSVRRIADSFNVGADTIAFIDDSAFERAEVAAGAPLTRIYEHDQHEALLDLAEFKVAATPEARSRRAFYRNEELRQTSFAQSKVDYMSFLRLSNIRVKIEEPNLAQADRIHELVQRTNQLNFSGNRYSRTQIEQILSDSNRDTYLVSAVDNYGSYGQIGFAIVERGSIARVVDLAFSCRVQSKTVEHAVLRFLLERYRNGETYELDVYFRKSERNAQVGKVLEELGFEMQSERGAEQLHRFHSRKIDLQNQVVVVEFIKNESTAQLKL